MLEGGARITDDNGEVAEPGDDAQPVSFGLRAAWRVGALTLRAGADAEMGGRAARVPVAASGAALFALGAESRGFFGLEVGVDAARAAPLLIVPEMAYLMAWRVPVRFGVAAPLFVDPDTRSATLSALLRIVFELDD